MLAKGLNASPGAAVGKVYFTADDAEAHAEAGEQVILVRPETSPDDLHGMIAAEGILTSRGGLSATRRSSHAGMGKPAICGADALKIDCGRKQFVGGDGTVVHEGDVISIVGIVGRDRAAARSRWSRPSRPATSARSSAGPTSYRTLKVRTNADLPEDAAKAREFGAEGIGLCRTEHMFLGDRLPIVQRMILADTDATKRPPRSRSCARSRSRLRRHPRGDGRPPGHGPPARPAAARVPPRSRRADREGSARHDHRAGDASCSPRRRCGARRTRCSARAAAASASSSPVSTACRSEALMQAAVTRKRHGGNPIVEIMIPLDRHRARARAARAAGSREEADAIVARRDGVEVDYLVGTMIETPRAALVADEIAEVAEFFSFGTNDLTQMTFGFSRDDVEGRFMPQYLEHKLLAANPFETLDVEGVGQLVRMGVEQGRATARDIKLGICGEHGGDPDVGRVLPRGRPRLRVVLAVPRADRPARGRARGARGRSAPAPTA